MRDIYLVNCCRTAVGSMGGSLKDTPAPQLGAIVIKEALKRAGLDAANVDEVMMGCTLSAGLGQNPARQAAVNAGVPVAVPAYTVSMVCGSGMKAVIEAARAIAAGDAEVVVAGGMENMSAAPYALPDLRYGKKMDVAMAKTGLVDTMVNDGLWDAFNNYHMGTTAENVCDIWGITREELDDFGYSSQMKYKAAFEAGKFKDEIVPVPVRVKKDIVDFAEDEFPQKNPDREKMGKLKGAFKLSADNAFKANGGTVEDTFGAKATKKVEHDGSLRVTAGNASGINDGAAAIVLASGEAVKKYGLKPMLKLTGWGQGGVDPKIMGTGPVAACQNLMKKTGLKVEDFDLIEANEAFAAQSLAVVRELGFDMNKVNVNGGALAIGHPVGCSGARIIVTLAHEMLKRPEAKKGLATLCIGGGMGVAASFEKA
ncbi:MAG: acetyl-CoA C-acetyltransferase [Oscillospiraceae bacterium]|nr:acetyl-CoA C-acetyltransferase [Oscillospiraceae bacterium]